jgi:outer membrane protein insertion porin family
VGARVKQRIFLIALCFLLSQTSHALRTISKIIISGTHRDTQIAEIRRALGFAEGDILDDALLPSAIKRIENNVIYRFAHIATRADEKGMQIVVDVGLVPVLKEFEVQSTPNLLPLFESRLKVLKGEYCNESELRNTMEDLKEASRKLGFFKANINYSLTLKNDNEWSLHVNVEENEPARIERVEVRSPHLRLSKEILETAGLFEGAQYRRSLLLDSLKSWRESKHASRYFDAHAQLVSDTYSSTTNTVNLVIQVDTGRDYPMDFSGVTYFSSRFLRQEITRILTKVESGSTHKPRVVSLLLNLYRRHGFRDAKIELDDNLSIRVQEGPQYLISAIVVNGKDPSHLDVETRLREILKDAYASESINDPASIFVSDMLVFDERVLAKAKSQLQDELNNKGFLNAKISGPQLHINPHNHFVTLTLTPVLGTRATIETLAIEVSDFFSRKDLLEKCLNFKIGDPFLAENLETPRSCMEELLWNQGYPYAQVFNETDISPDNTLVKIRFHAKTGPFVRIGKIDLRGLVSTRIGTLTPRVEIVSGEPYSLQKIAATRQAFFNSDIVDRVDIFTESSEGSEDERTLVIDIHEKARTSIELGLGASLEDGPRVSLLTAQRNLFGLGMGFKSRLQLNYPALFYSFPFLYPPKYQQVLQNLFKDESPFIRALLYTEAKLSLSLDYPYMLTAPWRADGVADFSLNRELKIAYTLNKVGLDTGLTIKPVSYLRFGPFIEYEFAKFYCPSYKEGLGCGTVSGTVDPATRRIDSGATHQVSFRLAGTLDGRDSVLRPKNGYFLDAYADFSLGRADLANESSYRPIRYIKLLGSFNVFRPLSKSATWHLSTKIGQIFQLAENDYVPLFKRFYLGGTNSIRGFAEDQILPADDANWPADSVNPIDPGRPAISLGGNFFVLVRGEIRFPFSDEHDGAVFIDAGELLDSTRNFSLSSLAVGAGFGVRYLTPIGPLMFDLGIRIVDGIRAYNSGFWQLFGLHFSIGYF